MVKNSKTHYMVWGVESICKQW